MYLLDTNVVAELRKPKPNGALLRWLRSIPEAELFLSAATIGELESGIEGLRERDEAKAESLTRWLDLLAATRNILPMDQDAFWLWAKLLHRKPQPASEDAMIAATALLHDLTVVTRNTRAFAAFDVPLLDPFLAEPRGPVPSA